MDTRTWITTLEVLALAALLLLAPAPVLRVLVGIPLVIHLAWQVLSSVPAGGIPGPPPGVGERRRNHRLRYRVVEFLREVKRVEAYARQATDGGAPSRDMEKNLRGAEQRLHDIIGEIVRVAGQTGV